MRSFEHDGFIYLYFRPPSGIRYLRLAVAAVVSVTFHSRSSFMTAHPIPPHASLPCSAYRMCSLWGSSHSSTPQSVRLFRPFQTLQTLCPFVAEISKRNPQKNDPKTRLMNGQSLSVAPCWRLSRLTKGALSSLNGGLFRW